MRTFKFIIDRDYLAAHALFWGQGDRPFPSWIKLRTRLESEYGKIPFNYREALWFVYPADLRGRKGGGPKDVWARSLVRNARRSREFGRLFKETQRSLAKIEAEWSVIGSTALAILQEISGLRLPQRTIPVYVTHPRQGNGSCCGFRMICFSHREDWEYYDTVYLCHELLHVMTRDSSEIMHALVKLAVDNELRIRLQGERKYFPKTYGGVNNSTIARLLPFWRTYLKDRPFRTIVGLKRHLMSRFPEFGKENQESTDNAMGVDPLSCWAKRDTEKRNPDARQAIVTDGVTFEGVRPEQNDPR